MQAMDIIESKSTRDSLSERVEVLDKVKRLMLIPKMEVMTTKQVAEYFEVDNQVIQRVYLRNRSEIDSDGVTLKFLKDFLNVQNVHLESTQGKTTIQVSDDMTIEIANRGTRCFSRRAILRIAMLLRDSRVAKEVRTQLLNIVEKTDENTRVADIDDEQRLIGNFAMSLAAGNTESTLLAFKALYQFQNRHIQELTKANENLDKLNKLLSDGINEWDNRAVLNAMVRSAAYNRYDGDFRKAWGTYYKRLLYGAGINLKKRSGVGGRLDKIEDGEWIKVLQIAAAWLIELNIDVMAVINETNTDNLELLLAQLNNEDGDCVDKNEE